MLKDNLNGTVSDDDSALLDRIHGTCLRMDALVDDLLAYAEMNRAHEKINLEPVDINPIVQTILNELKADIEHSHADISTDSLPKVQAHPYQLQLALKHIISNALHYSKKDATPKISISADPNPSQDGMITLRVQDDGIGIADEYLEKIFDPFYRLVRQNDYPGSGLGLTTAKHNIEAIGGSIKASPGLSSGAEFILKLPAADNP